jgi:hypothetical protein
MKRALIALLVVLMTVSVVYADRVGPVGGNPNTMVQVITLQSGTYLNQDMSSKFVGFYPHQIEYVSATDDTFKLYWKTAGGETIIEETISDGTTGGMIRVPGKPDLFTGVPQYSLILFSGTDLVLTFTGIR